MEAAACHLSVLLEKISGLSSRIQGQLSFRAFHFLIQYQNLLVNLICGSEVAGELPLR